MNWNDASFVTSFGSLSQLPAPEKVEIAISGRSNVGKSSLINKLLNRKALARVSSVPGKTVTINFYEVGDIYIADLPGYGYAKTAKGLKRSWSDLIGGYLVSDRELELVVQLIDIRHAPSEDDLSMIDFLIDNEMPFVIVFTKADTVAHWGTSVTTQADGSRAVVTLCTRIKTDRPSSRFPASGC